MVAKKITVLALVTFALCAENPITRALCDQEAEIGHSPHITLILREEIFECTGIVLSDLRIITAAECVVKFGTQSYAASSLSIRAGSNNPYQGGVTRQVKNVTVHEGYANNLNNLAILELTEALQFNGNINKIALLTDEVPVGSNVNISGWGRVRDDNVAALLQFNTANVVSSTLCGATFGIVSNSVLCVGPSIGICAYTVDAGGAASYNGKLAGVGSSGVNGFGSTILSIYTKVSAHSNWINENLV